jgi:hypothetical protein
LILLLSVTLSFKFSLSLALPLSPTLPLTLTPLSLPEQHDLTHPLVAQGSHLGVGVGVVGGVVWCV